ncbi:hypothetical protein CLCR_10494 [Cladophialophora carrionii]|uniref:Uncharacterized protein n=1 Tax=Cladophialophora carrionii TaxID=86049 RepID=A0A1C1CW22_9EURO|nr:hypothetical protein CLCR_10494 [Cladophialophora carrionii]
MGRTIYDCLTQPNTQLIVRTPTTLAYTQHDEWAPVETIQQWEDFNFTSLNRRYKEHLVAEADESLFSTVRAAEDAGHNVIHDEAALSLLHGSTNISIVSRSLPAPLFLAPGSRIIAIPHVRPDWGAGSADLQYTSPIGVCHALVCGDTKLGWDVDRAIRLVDDGSYEEQPDSHIVRPFEQIQHYCTVYQTRYGFILTDKCVVLIRVRLSPPTAKNRATRPQRHKVSEGHQRVLSNTSTGTTISDVSDTFSVMSFRPKPQDEDVAVLEVLRVAWSHGSSEETINLAVYHLILLSAESRHLSHHYEELQIEDQTKPEKRKRLEKTPEQSSKRGARMPPNF